MYAPYHGMDGANRWRNGAHVQINIDAANRFIQHATGIDVVTAHKEKAKAKESPAESSSASKKAKSRR